MLFGFGLSLLLVLAIMAGLCVVLATAALGRIRQRRQQADARYRTVRRRALNDLILSNFQFRLKDPGRIAQLEPRDMPILAEVMVHHLSNLRGGSMQRMRDTARELGLDDWYRAVLAQRGTPDRHLAIEIAGLMGDTDLVEALRPIMRSGPPELSLAAMEALARLGQGRDFAECFPRLGDLVARNGTEVARILELFGSLDAKLLIRALEVPGLQPDIEAALGAAIAAVGTPEQNARAAHRHILSLDDTLRAVAYRMLARSGTATLADIERGAHDPSWRVRLEAIECAKTMTPFPAAIFEDLLADEDWSVSLRAARVATRFGEAGEKLCGIVGRRETPQRSA